jgi:threonine dehydratase/serine racemase
VPYAVDIDAIFAARERIAPFVHRTPVVTSRTLDEIAGRRLFLKCENLQRGGAFKIRGATNAILALSPEQRARGVVTHSSGNHGQALAIAARAAGVRAFVVVPRGAPAVKRAAIAGYGAEIIDCDPTLEAREATARSVVNETGASLIPPYDQPAVIAGQGTVMLELAEQAPELDAVVAPVGGGGLVSGMAIAARALMPSVRVVGAEPAGADDAARSKAAGERQPQTDPRTIADGLRTSLGELTWPVVRDLVHEIVTVDDAAIVACMRLVFERVKLVVEPSGVVSLAAAMSGRIPGERIGVVLSGGNVDLAALPF